jgi:hypothetical protein
VQPFYVLLKINIKKALLFDTFQDKVGV